MFWLCFLYLIAKQKKHKIHKMADNVYNLINLGYPNIGVVVGTQAVSLIESGMGDYKDHRNKNVLKLIQTITNKPIKYVINLHSHPIKIKRQVFGENNKSA